MWAQKNYRQHIDQVKYHPVTDTPEIILAKKNAQLVSNVSELKVLAMITPSSQLITVWALSFNVLSPVF